MRVDTLNGEEQNQVNVCNGLTIHLQLSVCLCLLGIVMKRTLT
jgi:hypothetical protein